MTSTTSNNKPNALRKGKGAKCRVLLRMVHPGKLRDETFGNRTFQQKADFVIVRKDAKTIRVALSDVIVLKYNNLLQ